MTAVSKSRNVAIDALRGFIIVLMALDHANNFIAQQHPDPEFWAMVFPSYAEPLSFVTRWATHLAAPGFFFLMGVGMSLFAESRMGRGWSRGQVRKHFLIRGSMLIALQFLVENPAWRLIPTSSSGLYFGVLYGLGGAMILASALVWLPARVQVGMGALLLVGIQALVGASSPGLAVAPASSLIAYLAVPTLGGPVILYPILPWLGVALFGLAFGRLLSMQPDKAAQRLGWVGLGLLGVFVGMRLSGGFGNTHLPASSSWIDFLNVTKYPPSLAFLCLTLGINLTILALFWRFSRFWLAPLTVFGRVPLFFYVAHLYLYGWIGRIFFPTGASLVSMYPIWLLGLGGLYPLCILFHKWKKSDPNNQFLQYL